MRSPPMRAVLETPRFLKVTDAAKRLNVSDRFIYAAISENRGLPIIRFGKLIRIRIEDLDAWAEAHIVNPRKEPVNV